MFRKSGIAAAMAGLVLLAGVRGAATGVFGGAGCDGWSYGAGAWRAAGGGWVDDTALYGGDDGGWKLVDGVADADGDDRWEWELQPYGVV